MYRLCSTSRYFIGLDVKVPEDLNSLTVRCLQNHFILMMSFVHHKGPAKVDSFFFSQN